MARQTQPIAVYCVNEGRKQDARQTRADFRAIKHNPPTVGWPKLIGFQEIDEADPAPEREILEQVFKRGHRIIGAHTRVPIVVSSKFKINEPFQIEVSEGIPGVSPARILNECVVETRLGEVAFIDGHAVSGAWNRKTSERAEDERDRAWAQYQFVCGERIRAHRSQGRSVFRVGDDNRMGGYQMHRHERVLIRAGVVLISFTPAEQGLEFVGQARGNLRTNSDHPAPWVRGHLR